MRNPLSSLSRLARTATAGATASTSRAASASMAAGRRSFGFASGSGSWNDGSNPVVRDSLVPIVVEQTVSGTMGRG